MGILVSVGSDSDSKFGLTLELDKGKVKFKPVAIVIVEKAVISYAFFFKWKK